MDKIDEMISDDISINISASDMLSGHIQDVRDEIIVAGIYAAIDALPDDAQLTTTEAAKVLRLGRASTVAQYIRRGQFPAVRKAGRDYVLTPDDLREFQRTRREPGRPYGIALKDD